MIFEEKKIILKNGKTATLKSPCVEDAGRVGYQHREGGSLRLLIH